MKRDVGDGVPFRGVHSAGVEDDGKIGGPGGGVRGRQRYWYRKGFGLLYPAKLPGGCREYGCPGCDAHPSGWKKGSAQIVPLSVPNVSPFYHVYTALYTGGPVPCLDEHCPWTLPSIMPPPATIIFKHSTFFALRGKGGFSDVARLLTAPTTRSVSSFTARTISSTPGWFVGVCGWRAVWYTVPVELLKRASCCCSLLMATYLSSRNSTDVSS